MSDTNRTQVAIVEESTIGVTPTNPVYEIQRVTGSTLAYNPTYTESEEIRADRQLTDIALVGAEASGDINYELSFGTLDTVIEGGMYSEWQNKPTDVNTASDTPITVDDINDQFDIAGGTESYVVGHLINASGFVANDGLWVADTGTSGTSIQVTGDLAAETAPSGARVRVVGFAGTTGDLQIDANGDMISTTLDFTTLGLVIGEWIKIGGTATANQFATAANNSWVRISAITANKLEFDEGNTAFVADTGIGKDIYAFAGSYIRNGTTGKSYSIERQYQDHSPVSYETFKGMVVGSISFSFDSQSIVGVTVNWLGTNMETGQEAGATYTSANSNSIMNTSSNVGRISENGAALTTNRVMSSTIEINDNLRGLAAIGVLGYYDIGAGEASVSGSVETYFENQDLYNKLINNQETSYNLRVNDNDGQTLIFDIPRVKFESGAPSVDSKNSDVMLPLDMRGLRDETYGYTLQIQRFYVTA